MKIVSTQLIIGGLSALTFLSPAAEISWGTPSPITTPFDISNPGGSTVIVAADFNSPTGTAVGDDNIINGIPFEQMPNAGNGTLVTSMNTGPAYGTGFFTGNTGDSDLDALLDSHSYIGANPGEITVTVNNLVAGREYQIQLIAVADARSCCAGRTYEPDDGQGNYNTGLEMNRGGFFQVTGTFVADATSQSLLWRSLGGTTGNSDPGFSGLVVLEIPSIGDADGDGLFDVWETANGLNPNSEDSDGDLILDGDEDEDNDFSTNLQEQNAGTSITSDDTDNDGYLDGHETDTGTWSGDTNTGTNPLRRDTDGDGLDDGVENPDLPFVDANQTGSDPNLLDTDGDLRSDQFEVDQGSDPRDPNSNTPLPLSGLLGGDLTDPEDDGIDTAGATGQNFNWVSITASSEAYFSDATSPQNLREGAFDLFDNKVGGGEAKWCCGGAPQSLTVEFAEPVSITNFTMTSGNDTPARDPINWEIQGSNDGITFTPVYTSTQTGLWTGRNQTLLFSLAEPAPPYTYIRYSVTSTGGGEHQLNEIEYFGNVGGSSPLEITGIDYDPAGETVSLTWSSAPGRTYRVEAGDDLVSFPVEIIDALASGGETTTYQFANPNPGATKQFFRVVEN